MLRLDVITIFPSMFDSYLRESILARAQKKRLIKITAHNLRDHASGKHKTVDDSPYGGGAGMVLKIEPIYRAVSALTNITKHKPHKTQTRKNVKIILLSAKGKQFTQQMAQKYAKLDRIIFICGRYEGVDERVVTHIADEEISIGPYVLTGGELPAMVMIDAISRHIPGVLGNKDSLNEESFSRVSFPPLGHTRDKLQRESRILDPRVQPEDDKKHEYPHYTRPAIFEPKKGITWKIPKILLSGDHQKIAEWRRRHTQ